MSTPTSPAPAPGIQRFCPKIMFQGDSGVGKTFSAALLSDHGITVRFIFTENGMSTLEAMEKKYTDRLGKELDYMYVAPTDRSFDEMIDLSSKINALSYKSLSEMTDQDKKRYKEYLMILKALKNYKSDLTGKEYGAVDKWGDNECIVLDSLSGLSVAIMGSTAGATPVKSPNIWYMAMQQEEALVQKLCLGTRCWFILNAHMEREVDENSGTTKIYPSATGKKNGPKFGRFFDEVINPKKGLDGKFSWSTKDSQAVLKQRWLPFSDNLKPDWKPIVDRFNESKARAEALRSII